MASEDHDFQEVNHIYLFGEKIEWKNKQNGAVGKMNLCGFEEVISKLKITLGSHKNADRLISLFEQSYLNHKNLSDATRFLVNELFAKYGLVIIDGDDKDLKKQFIPQIKKDILQNGFVDNIRQCSNNLAKNYKSQAFVRDINFFKLSKGNRQLIVKNTCEREIDEHPERFSPNVLLRPLYQEVILPNVAYVGGEAEVAYWMQLKTAFKQEAIPFPILVLRNSALLVNSKQQYVFQKLGFELEDIFLSEHELTKRYVLASSNSEISLLNEKIALDLLFQKIISKTSDLSLQNSIRAQLQKQLSSLDNIQEKLVRIEKKKNESAINQIAKIKRQLFPNNLLQERSNNFIAYYLQDFDSFIKKLKNNLDPLSPNFVVLTIKN
jgi:bacillithiol biosynthesis cysteine-adding enzyme BshC